MTAQPNPFDKILTEQGDAKYYDFTKLNDPRIAKLPVTIRVLLEAAIRNCDEFLVSSKDVEAILDWSKTQTNVEIPFKPARVIMQDFTGVPAVVDLAAMRDCVARLGGDPKKINPLVPVDLVIDHSIQVDNVRTQDALDKNEAKEFERNSERFQFLKWGSTAFDGLQIVPPGNGIVHQVNLEYLARVVFKGNGLLYPDTLVGTDSHTTMINGLGCLGWGVGGIEAEAAMLGQPMAMVLPAVVGFELTGTMPAAATATDVVLTITAQLRKFGVVGKFVEFFGTGVASLSLADRATISNMAPEYGATCGFFPIDEVALEYCTQTGRSAEQTSRIRDYLKAVGLFADFSAKNEVEYSAKLHLDLSEVVPCIAGPKLPQDNVAVAQQKADFNACMQAEQGYKGFGIPAEQRDAKVTFNYEGKDFELNHGSIVIAAITSCTNTSNPSVLIGAGLVAKKALDLGVKIAPYIKTSLSPGSQAVAAYLKNAGLLSALEAQGFAIAGFGCMTCIGNSGELVPGLSEAIVNNKLVATSVLSGNRNFEARVHPDTAGNYLASPPLVVAYAIAGTMNIDLQNDVIAKTADGKDVYLKDIWPTPQEIQDYIKNHVTADIFGSVYSNMAKGNARWDALKVPEDNSVYAWDPKSTYIHNPPFFAKMTMDLPKQSTIKDATCLCYFGHSITTDHISPAGKIAATSPAAKFLSAAGVQKADFNSYGARRGNDEVMVRGTFANTRISNKIIAPTGTTGPVTTHFPTGEQMSIFDASAKYQADGQDLVIVAGKEYGSGSSRDWAAKGSYLLGVKAVIAESFERIHRSNLAGMGIIPMCFMNGETGPSLGIKGNEKFTIDLPEKLTPGVEVTVTAGDIKFQAKVRLDTAAEISYYQNGGILHYVLRNKLQA